MRQRRRAAGVDLGQLIVVADQNDLGTCGLGMVEEAGELSSPDNGGLVDNDDRSRVERHRAVAVEVTE